MSDFRSFAEQVGKATPFRRETLARRIAAYEERPPLFRRWQWLSRGLRPASALVLFTASAGAAVVLTTAFHRAPLDPTGPGAASGPPRAALHMPASPSGSAGARSGSPIPSTSPTSRNNTPLTSPANMPPASSQVMSAPGSTAATCSATVLHVEAEPTTSVNDSSVGSDAWRGPDGGGPGSPYPWIGAAGSAASLTQPYLAAGKESNYLQVAGFNFRVPSDATICGIVASFRVEAQNSAVADGAVRLLKGGVLTGVDRSSRSGWPMATFSAPNWIYAAHGSSGDLWAATLTPADVDSPDFGVALAAVNHGGGAYWAAVDDVQITVYYAVPSGSATPSPP